MPQRLSTCCSEIFSTFSWTAEMKWRSKRHLTLCAAFSAAVAILLVALYYFNGPLYDLVLQRDWNTDDDFSGALYDTASKPSAATIVTSKDRAGDAFQLLPLAEDIFRSDVRSSIRVYLTALHRSVKVVHLPSELSQEVINRCRQISARGRLDGHQHSVELHFPRVLYAMSHPHANTTRRSGATDFSLIHSETKHKVGDQIVTSDPPLFTYVAAFAYHAIYCTRKSRGKEDWSRRDPYWLAVAEHLQGSVKGYEAGGGSDLLLVASHPMSGPSRIHPFALSYLHRATFLRTDFDVSGSAPKDIVVPYFSPGATQLGRNGTVSSAAGTKYKYFIYFSGADNPKQGYRSQMKSQVDALVNDPATLRGVQQSAGRVQYETLIHFSTESVPGDQYVTDMSRSVFCLCVRGDTTSSRRLFTAIALGCVPVIVADWIQLPFERLLDYSRFTVRLPESSLADVPGMVRTLLDAYGGPATVARMQSYLRDAARLLIYPDVRALHQSQSGFHSKGPHARTLSHDAAGASVGEEAALPVLNPVTLTLIEALMRREDQCAKYPADSQLSGMCSNLASRLKKARASSLW